MVISSFCDLDLQTDNKGILSRCCCENMFLKIERQTIKKKKKDISEERS